MIFDRVKIYCKAGDGGNGSVSFHREKYVSHGGPDGGDGGKGGSIIFRVDKGATTLMFYKYKRKFTAQNGGDGKASKMHGANGQDLYLYVPDGTIIKDAESGLVIKDMSGCEEFILCKGGKGGWGNKHFATPTRQIPRFAKSGIRGEEIEVLLELKMIADVGLIGLPNVGKSSILSRISASKPKIADYNFTTLSPNLGVVSLGEDKGFICADIPGLIEGASEGAGLGHEFLRHIERCRLLVHVVDVSERNERNPVSDIELINNELVSYAPSLADRPQILVANKIDALGEDTSAYDELKKYAEEKGIKLISISAATNKNINLMLNAIADLLRDLPPIPVFESEYVRNDISDSSNHDVDITFEKGVYFVEGDWLYKVMGSVNFEDRESLNYFQRILRKSGVIDALENAGCGDGDTVNIYDFEFDFVK